MDKQRNLDIMDQYILQILSLYEHLNLLELWFEIGETGSLESVSKGEVLSRLYSLLEKGLVERIDFGNGNIRWALKKVERNKNVI